MIKFVISILDLATIGKDMLDWTRICGRLPEISPVQNKKERISLYLLGENDYEVRRILFET